MSTIILTSYKGVTYFNDSMGERKILTRNLLRDPIGSMDIKRELKKFPKIEGVNSWIKLSTPQQKNFNKKSTDPKTRDKIKVYPFSLLEKVMMTPKI